MDFSQFLTVFLIAMSPVLELRGAIPLAIGVYGWPWWQALVVSLAGNVLVVILLLKFLSVLLRFLAHFRFTRFVSQALLARLYDGHIDRYEKIGSVLLFFFVAIPLPGTGGWAGTILAYLFGIAPYLAGKYIVAGVLVAGLIVTFLTQGGILVFNSY